MRTLVFMTLLIAAAAAQGQVHRCADSRGRVVFSDLPCDRLHAIPAGAPGLSAANAGARVFQGHEVLGLIERASVESDAAARRNVLRELDMAAAAYTAHAHAAAQRQAQAEAGVAIYERQLEEARRADRADPLWKAGMGDSPITAGIQEQLLKARQAADTRVPQLLASNAEYQRVQAAYAAAKRQR